MGQKRKAPSSDISSEKPTKKAKAYASETVKSTDASPGMGQQVKSPKVKSPKVKSSKVKGNLSALKAKKVKKARKGIPVSEELSAKKTNWTNKTRVLMFSSRGISFQGRHLMKDVSRMMPQSKSETKLERKEKLFVINELCEMKNCTKCVFFESRKKMDTYLWLANTPNGPSAKFLIENVHTMHELKMTGNCLRGSRPLLSFNKEFDKEPHWMVLKEMLIQIFSTPHNHPKSQPFIDRVAQFSIADGKIWYRNYEIIDESGELVEIGPRMVLNPIRIFSGSFCGETLYKNTKYVTPNTVRSLMKKTKKMRYLDRVDAKKSREARHEEVTYPTSLLDDVFQTS